MTRGTDFFLSSAIVGMVVALGVSAGDGGNSPTTPAVAAQAVVAASIEVAGGEGATAAQEQALGGKAQQERGRGAQRREQEPNGEAPGRQEQVTLCHRTASGAFRLITVAAASMEPHLAHGDVEPGTGGLGAECEPAANPTPTTAAVTLTPTVEATETPAPITTPTVMSTATAAGS